MLELDGSFALPKLPSGRRVPRLQMVLKENQLSLLQSVRDFLGAGKVALYDVGKGSLGTKRRAHLRLDGREAINTLIPFLDKHPFQGPKLRTYERWRMVVDLIEQGAQDTESGRRLVDQLAEQVNMQE